MQLNPIYDGAPVLAIEGPAADQREPLVRQRRRMATVLAGLTDEQWAAPSRCEGWSVQDVVAHLNGTNLFWAASINAGRAGAPTRMLVSFDPVATPAQMVAATRSQTPSEVLGQFIDSNQALFDAIDGLDTDGWSTIAESPVGHVPIRLVAHHALWDAWVHERDVVVPLGIASVEEPDEVESCLRYAAALGPVLGHASHPERRGSIVIDATDPEIRLVVEVGDTVEVHGGAAPADAVTISGGAVDLIDGLSIRAPLGHAVPDATRWLLGGLAEAFDTTLDRG